MCIVLPQGRFNNTTDEYIRRFVSENGRIMAVISLQTNTFKPHTGTKTSILFLQKWNEDSKVGPLCPRRDDYSIFFAVSENSGKNNSGEYTYRIGSDGLPVLDQNGHMIVRHDLDTITADFSRFAEKQKLSFATGK